LRNRPSAPRWGDHAPPEARAVRQRAVAMLPTPWIRNVFGLATLVHPLSGVRNPFAGGEERCVRAEAGKVTAAFKDGVVTITLPKAPEAKGTTIPVKAA
jgi:hypothetical protein